MPHLSRIPLAALAAVLLLWSAPAALGQAQDVRVITTWDEPLTLADGSEAVHHYEISYDYATNQAVETVYDSDGALLSTRPLDGAPQPNDEEIAEAIALIEADPELAPITQRADIVIDGGFLRYEGVCSQLRCLQFEIGAADGSRLERFVVVELSEGVLLERDLFPHLRD